ncbi:hypothetical protein J1N35_003081 [Gossypium stocksii]|uniref:Uncharacterized protein n=1 Tax=Gossypium stocksii TaxID=47602 RepID=A0A9D4APF1_9ROSI|nr:hypothetical protein J1N35_003081 [Gossypium stocksii]
MVSDNWSSNNDLLINVMQLTDSLKDWKREVFRNIFWRKKDVIAQLQKEEVLYQENLLWKQKVQCDYLCHGDHNTRYSGVPPLGGCFATISSWDTVKPTKAITFEVVRSILLSMAPLKAPSSQCDITDLYICEQVRMVFISDAIPADISQKPRG